MNGTGTGTVHSTVVRQVSATAGKHVGIAGIGTASEVAVQAMPWWQMLGVRVLRMYLQTFLGLGGTDAVGAVDLGTMVDTNLPQILNIALLALAPTAVSLLHNLLEYLTKLDLTHPQFRG